VRLTGKGALEKGRHKGRAAQPRDEIIQLLSKQLYALDFFFFFLFPFP
jgi:hypothetical protein